MDFTNFQKRKYYGCGNLSYARNNGQKSWCEKYLAKAKPSQYSPLPHFTLARLTSNLNKEQMNQINVWMKHSKVSNTSVFCQDICLYTRADKDYSNKYTIVESEALSHNCGETLCTGHNSEWEKCTTNGF